MARRTADLFRDPSLCVQMGATARRLVETRWPIARTIAQWREVYQGVCSGMQAPR
jgi:hypothetical protein